MQRSIREFFLHSDNLKCNSEAVEKRENSLSKKTRSPNVSVKRQKVEHDFDVICISDDESGANGDDSIEVARSEAVPNAKPENNGEVVSWEGVDYLDLNNFLELLCKSDDNVDTLNEAFLETDFKLKTFVEMVYNVLQDEQYFKLFNDDDWNVVKSFSFLSGPAQQLYVRLFIRKREWKRKIEYPDIDNNLTPYLQELVKARLLLPTSSLLSLKTALNLLDHSEVKLLVKDLKGVVLNGKTTKEAAIAAIMKHVKSSQSIHSSFLNKSGNNNIVNVVVKRIHKMLNYNAYCVNGETCGVFVRLSLLYFPPQLNDEEIGVSFGNEVFNLMKVANGSVRYPEFIVEKKTETFKTRNDLINYEQSCCLEQEILEAIEKKDSKKVCDQYLKTAKSNFNRIVSQETMIADRRLPEFLRRFTAGYVLVRCVSHCVPILEQCKLHHEAVNIYKYLLQQTVYCVDYRGKWYERLAINQEAHLKEHSAALETICKALQDSTVRVASRYSLYRRGLRLKKSVGRPFVEIKEYSSLVIPQITIEGTTLRKSVNERKNIFVRKEEFSVNVMTVETVVLEHYKKLGFSGVHCEGLVYHAIFGLLLWDVIYLSVKDVFRTPYQSVPLDLNSDSFFINRKEVITERLKCLSEMTVDEMCAELQQVWDLNNGRSSLVNWETVNDVQILKDVVQCIKVNPVVKICERLAKQFRYTRSGFPDLLVWNTKENSVKAVEVKGPGDQLSPKQALWIDYLNMVGLEAEVCYVKSKKINV